MAIGGTLVNAVVRIIVLAATLALVYFLILKPILATTESISDSANFNTQQAIDSVNEAFQGTSQQGSVTQFKIKSRVKKVNGVNQQKLLKCVQNANQDINRIQRCANRYTP